MCSYFDHCFVCCVAVQERGGASAEFAHENMMIKFKMDNEFELVYVVRDLKGY